MNALEELRDAVRWTQTSLDLDVDVRAHVFELTIRSLGGLLSAHTLLIRDPSLVPGASRSDWPIALRCWLLPVLRSRPHACISTTGASHSTALLSFSATRRCAQQR